MVQIECYTRMLQSELVELKECDVYEGDKGADKKTVGLKIVAKRKM